MNRPTGSNIGCLPILAGAVQSQSIKPEEYHAAFPPSRLIAKRLGCCRQPGPFCRLFRHAPHQVVHQSVAARPENPIDFRERADLVAPLVQRPPWTLLGQMPKQHPRVTQLAIDETPRPTNPLGSKPLNEAPPQISHVAPSRCRPMLALHALSNTARTTNTGQIRVAYLRHLFRFH